MKRAGCDKVYIGFESVNDKTLKAFNKRSSLEKNEMAVRRFHEAGIRIHGMFVLGSDEDTVETVHDTVKFAKRLKIDTAQFFSLITIPGTPLMERYRDEGKILTKDWHLYDGHHVVIRPEKILPHVLQSELGRAHLNFYSWKEALRYLIDSNSRLVNAGIRIQGNLLTREVLKDTSHYQKNLEALDQWNFEVETLYQRLRKKYETMAHDVREEWTRRTEPIKGSVEEFVHGVRSSMESVSEEFVPYCHRHVASILEKAKAHLNIEELSADWFAVLWPATQKAE